MLRLVLINLLIVYIESIRYSFLNANHAKKWWVGYEEAIEGKDKAMTKCTYDSMVIYNNR